MNIEKYEAKSSRAKVLIQGNWLKITSFSVMNLHLFKLVYFISYMFNLSKEFEKDLFLSHYL